MSANETRARAEELAAQIQNRLSPVPSCSGYKIWWAAKSFPQELAPLLEAHALRERLEEARECTAIVKEYGALDWNTPYDEGHREFHKKYDEVDIEPVLQKRIAELERQLRELEGR